MTFYGFLCHRLDSPLKRIDLNQIYVWYVKQEYHILSTLVKCEYMTSRLLVASSLFVENVSTSIANILRTEYGKWVKISPVCLEYVSFQHIKHKFGPGLLFYLKELHINWNHNYSNHINSYDQWSNEPVNLGLNFDITTNYILENYTLVYSLCTVRHLYETEGHDTVVCPD